MACNRLVNAASATGATSAVTYPRVLDRTGIFQAEISSSATVKLQGRVDSNAPWVDIVSLTSSDAKVVALFPSMRVSYTVVSGTVSAWLMD